MLSRHNNKIIRKKKIPTGNFLFFCAGMLVGFLFFFTLTIAVALKDTAGINIFLRGETVLDIVNQEIESQMQKEFPVLVAEIKTEIPFLVEKYTQGFISIGKLEIGGYTVNLPPQFIRELEDDLRRDVTFYVLDVLQGMEEQEFVREFSQKITKDIIHTFMEDFNGQVIKIPLTRYYSIPVTVRLN